ncbi:putative HTH-type transcriptional regulator [Methanocella paludicola SANAE]|uniref:HTH-type transcriptional regulator n=1 Tax=Methanocella paludicola (strain DSM 17711 / JCM 13418 / NBRC 101707 / SANAE) TaxID=304371 RepID=D1YVK5_METPS|nr:putative HTH-type transcriptional regulator [Methanocella paludicola SANAE]
MRPPCELTVWYVIPTIRAELSKELIKLGLSQKEVSERLGITQSAVSQYVKDKRGKGVPVNKEVRKAIKALARDIAAGNAGKGVIPGICAVCAIVKQSGSLCDLHRQEDADLEGCDMCLNISGG